MDPQIEPASNIEWRQWGKVDPFWAVAAWPDRQRSGNNPWTPEDFYDLGSKDWADFRAHWGSYGVARGLCVEIGCGAGRLTMHIAKDFEEVVGVDVSEGMLRVAREYVTAPNVILRLCDGVRIPVATATADGVFSCHVFQHFESLEVARANFAEVARVLRPGGSALIHLPMYWLPRGLPLAERVLALRKRLGDVHAKMQRRKGKLLMRGLSYPVDWLLRELPPLGFSEVAMEVFATSSNGSVHPCVLMRRSATT